MSRCIQGDVTRRLFDSRLANSYPVPTLPRMLFIQITVSCLVVSLNTVGTKRVASLTQDFFGRSQAFVQKVATFVLVVWNDCRYHDSFHSNLPSGLKFSQVELNLSTHWSLRMQWLYILNDEQGHFFACSVFPLFVLQSSGSAALCGEGWLAHRFSLGDTFTILPCHCK